MCQDDYITESVVDSGSWISRFNIMDLYTFDPTVKWDTWIQLVLFLSGVIVLYVQLKAQRDLSRDNHIRQLELQENQHRDKIQLEVYEKLTSEFEECMPTGMSTTFNLLMNEFDKAIERTRQGLDYVPPPFYLDNIDEQFKKLHRRISRLMATLDKYQIVTPYLSLFSKVLSYKVTELGDHYLILVQVFAYIVLWNKESTDTLHVPTQQTVDNVKKRVAEFEETSWDIAYYLDDILTEAQNKLLGEFFPHSLPVRTPLDPDVLVLTSTRPDMIKRMEELVEEHQQVQSPESVEDE